MCYRGAGAIILVFDLTAEKSFESLRYWHEQVKKNGAADAYIILLANKSDM